MIIGTKVRVLNLVTKVRRLGITNYERTPCDVVGYYAGYRYRQKGVTLNHGEDGKEFISKGSVKHWLVYLNEKQNPIFADPETTEILQ